jgi:hypothetical protein
MARATSKNPGIVIEPRHIATIKRLKDADASDKQIAVAINVTEETVAAYFANNEYQDFVVTAEFTLSARSQEDADAFFDLLAKTAQDKTPKREAAGRALVKFELVEETVPAE